MRRSAMDFDVREQFARLLRPARSLPLVIQAQRGECAIACIVMIARYHGLGIDMEWLRAGKVRAGHGQDVRGLLGMAEGLHLEGRAVKLDMDDLGALCLPAILHWDMDHFVVLRKVGRRSIVIHDPAVGERHYSRQEAARHITGVAVELWPGSGFRRHSLVRPLRLRDLVEAEPALFTRGAGILLLTLAIQCIALLNPFYVQLTVDRGLLGGNPELIPRVALLFLLLALLKTLLVYVRGSVLLGFSHRLGFQLVGGVFRHLVSLPLGWFEARSMGEISSRFGTLQTVRRLLTQDVIAALVDGLFSLVTLALLYVYSPQLAAVATGLLLVFAGLRYLTAERERSYRNTVLAEDARQQSAFLENLQAITTLKVYGLEADRSRQWLSGYADYVNSAVQLDRFQNRTLAWQNLILGIDHVATIFIGAGLVLSQSMSAGQLIAFVFLKQHFINAVASLLPRLVELRLIGLELERLSDITAAQGARNPGGFPPPADAGLLVRVQGLDFGYPGSNQPVLQGVGFSLKEGDCLAISGPSGCGKTTLLKLLLGLLAPLRGSIQVNASLPGQANGETGGGDVAAVLHGDRLLAGSLLYNITLDREPLDRDWLQQCLAITGLRDDLGRLRDGLTTLLAESGSSLSAGQRQRLLLARALYGRPRLLILDEALANLETAVALQIVERLRSLGIALILVTHNPALRACAGHCLELGRSPPSEAQT
jgi:ATP-binding cassette subfamily B protein RaxB